MVCPRCAGPGRVFRICSGRHTTTDRRAGRGTSAKVACLARRREIHRRNCGIQESVIGSRFSRPTCGGRRWFRPETRIVDRHRFQGRWLFVTRKITVCLRPDDPSGGNPCPPFRSRRDSAALPSPTRIESHPARGETFGKATCETPSNFSNGNSNVGVFVPMSTTLAAV